MANRARAGLLGLALALGLAASPAWADSIDGNWCQAGGKRITIAGPSIVTPGGARIQGEYDRHHFSYVIPANEPGAGGTVLMTLMGEYRVAVRTGADASAAANAEAVDWQRCGPSISLLQRNKMS